MTAPILPPENAPPLRQQALVWFVQRQSTDWSDAQETAFQQWMALDPQHSEIYARCDEQWARLDGMPQDLVVKMRSQLAHDKAQQENESTLLTSPAVQAASSPPSARAAPLAKPFSLPFMAARRRFFQPVFAVAGVAAITGSASFFTWQHIQSQPVFTQAFHTERGQRKEVRLPDGSQLLLDTATRVEVTYYQQRREVKLIDGQVVFAVQSNKERPFDVLAGLLRVTVVGTRFSVRHTPGLPGDQGTQVAVEEGKVRVARFDAPEKTQQETEATVFLTAGQQVTSDTQGTLGTVTSVAAGGIAPWREQRVSFVDTPLSHALAELERYGHTDLVVHDPAVAALRLTGTFDPLDHAALRLALARVLPVQLKKTALGIEILPVR